MPPKTPIEVLKTPDGKYVWWPALQRLDYVRKGKGWLSPDGEFLLQVRQNHIDGAIRKACFIEAEVRKLKMARESRQVQQDLLR